MLNIVMTYQRRQLPYYIQFRGISGSTRLSMSDKSSYSTGTSCTVKAWGTSDSSCTPGLTTPVAPGEPGRPLAPVEPAAPVAPVDHGSSLAPETQRHIKKGYIKQCIGGQPSLDPPLLTIDNYCTRSEAQCYFNIWQGVFDIKLTLGQYRCHGGLGNLLKVLPNSLEWHAEALSRCRSYCIVSFHASLVALPRSPSSDPGAPDLKR